MRRYIQTFLSVCLTICLLGCSDEAILEGLTVQMVVLDQTGEETTELSGENKNFALALKAINHTDEEIEISSFSACSLAQNNEDFMMVYEKKNGNIAIGRPFGDEINCVAIGLLPISVPASSSIYLTKANWLGNPSNSALPPGVYLTKTSISINEKNVDTYVEFIIK